MKAYEIIWITIDRLVTKDLSPSLGNFRSLGSIGSIRFRMNGWVLSTFLSQGDLNLVVRFPLLVLLHGSHIPEFTRFIFTHCNTFKNVVSGIARNCRDWQLKVAVGFRFSESSFEQCSSPESICIPSLITVISEFCFTDAKTPSRRIVPIRTTFQKFLSIIDPAHNATRCRTPDSLDPKGENQASKIYFSIWNFISNLKW
jgi:hypothetical protein